MTPEDFARLVERAEKAEAEVARLRAVLATVQFYITRAQPFVSALVQTVRKE